jgi:hypothetical protein
MYAVPTFPKEGRGDQPRQLANATTLARADEFRMISWPTSENSVKAKFAENLSLLKSPSPPLPSTLQGLENPAIAVFWRGFLSVLMRFWTTDWSYNDFFNRLFPSTHSGE